MSNNFMIQASIYATFNVIATFNVRTIVRVGYLGNAAA
jgi:hypothetical protein